MYAKRWRKRVTPFIMTFLPRMLSMLDAATCRCHPWLGACFLFHACCKLSQSNLHGTMYHSRACTYSHTVDVWLPLPTATQSSTSCLRARTSDFQARSARIERLPCYHARQRVPNSCSSRETPNEKRIKKLPHRCYLRDFAVWKRGGAVALPGLLERPCGRCRRLVIHQQGNLDFF